MTTVCIPDVVNVKYITVGVGSYDFCFMLSSRLSGKLSAPKANTLLSDTIFNGELIAASKWRLKM